MKKPKKDPTRESRIRNEAIVDANGPEEQVRGWCCYLDEKIRFPFQAKCSVPKLVSPLRKGEIVEVLRMAPEDVRTAEAAPLSQLAGIDVDASTAEAIADWHYWVTQGYRF